jgi:hypothetical protein
MYRHKEMQSNRGRVQTADYAWSADKADFASVASIATFAYTADRLVEPPHPAPLEQQTALTRAAMDRLRDECEAAEKSARADAAQNAERAKFAGCADSAKYAMEAEVAYFAWKVKGLPARREHEGAHHGQ